MKESYRKLSINLCHSIKDFEEGLTCLRTSFLHLYILQEAVEMMNCKSVCKGRHVVPILVTKSLIVLCGRNVNEIGTLIKLRIEIGYQQHCR